MFFWQYPKHIQLITFFYSSSTLPLWIKRFRCFVSFGSWAWSLSLGYSPISCYSSKWINWLESLSYVCHSPPLHAWVLKFQTSVVAQLSRIPYNVDCPFHHKSKQFVPCGEFCWEYEFVSPWSPPPKRYPYSPWWVAAPIFVLHGEMHPTIAWCYHPLLVPNVLNVVGL